MSKLIEKINKEQIRTDIPEFRVGDTVRVGVKIKEGKKERVQNFEGIVFNITGGSVSKTFTVRKKVGSIGVERVFPVNSPLIDTITVVKKGKVRRSKLTFLRGMKKDYKVKEMNVYIEVIEAYINYFDWLSGNYRDSHDKVTKNLNEIQNVIQGDFVPSNLKIQFEDGDYNV